MSEVLREVPGQPNAIAFLERAVPSPGHAYLFAGPEGSGKQQAARAFAASLLCADGGCGTCRDCRLALQDRHPNVMLVEPEGRDIRVGENADEDGTARWMVSRAFLTPPEPGPKVLRIDQADRMTEEAADVLLKALEEPPADTVFVLSSARPDEIPETVRSRCQTVAFRPLPEPFVAEALIGEGVEGSRARLAARIAGGNLGRARRLATDPEGFGFRDAALEALAQTSRGSAGALDAAEGLLAGAAEYRGRLGKRLEQELEPFLDPDSGRPLEQYRAAIKRLQQRHQRLERRAEREYLDAALLALEAWFRDALLISTGGDPAWVINVDRPPSGDPTAAAEGARAIQLLEEGRAALADETNLNVRLVLEEALLGLASSAART
ncbi:MAG: AAA family ATPase [Actinomycetota bacterium]|nr:AAA family ATPase [Actinomycetota bacterium]